jgi:hypothetical protein
MGLGDHGSVTSTSSERWHLTPREQIKSPTRARLGTALHICTCDKCNRHTCFLRMFSKKLRSPVASSAAEGAPCLGISLRNLGLPASQKMLAQQVYRTKATLAALLILSFENSRHFPTIATMDKEWWYGARMAIWFTSYYFSGRALFSRRASAARRSYRIG